MCCIHASVTGGITAGEQASIKIKPQKDIGAVWNICYNAYSTQTLLLSEQYEGENLAALEENGCEKDSWIAVCNHHARGMWK